MWNNFIEIGGATHQLVDRTYIGGLQDELQKMVEIQRKLEKCVIGPGNYKVQKLSKAFDGEVLEEYGAVDIRMEVVNEQTDSMTRDTINFNLTNEEGCQTVGGILIGEKLTVYEWTRTNNEEDISIFDIVGMGIESGIVLRIIRG